MKKPYSYYINHSLKKLFFTGSLFGLLLGSPIISAQAANAPAFSTQRSSLYENGENSGTYTYTIKNVKKGYTVKWSLSGAGASYLTLKKASTPVTSKTVKNQVYVDTFGSNAAKNKKAVLTAKIYNGKGKLIRVISDKVTIKVNSSYLKIKTNKITDSLESLSINKSYDFDCTVSPANATSKLYWKVTSQAGKDCSNQITSDGIWTPTEEGRYSIEAFTKNSAYSRVVSSARIQAFVGSTLSEVRQTASDTVSFFFTGSMKDKVSLSDFSVSFMKMESDTSSTSYGSTVSLKSLSLSEDDTCVAVKAHSNFTNRGIYQVTYKGQVVAAFTASAGQPVSGVILTTTTPINTSREIDFLLYDQNGIDVTSLYKGTVTFDGIVPNGYVTSAGSLYMTTLGEYASVIMTCLSSEGSFTVNANILCTTENSSGIRAYITSSTDNPIYDGSTSSSNTSFYLGDTAYFYFELYDEKETIITYSNPYYVSDNTSIFTVDKDGKLTGKKAGTAYLTLYATVDSKQISYKTAVTVLPRRTPSQLLLSETNITMSNAAEDDYQTELTVSLYDQYHNSISLSTASVTIQEQNNKAVLARYDRSTGKIIISAQNASPGTYDYTLNLLLNGVRISAAFQVTVQAVPENGIETYLPQANTIIADTETIRADSEPLTINLRLARYINGIFAGYASMESATVQRNDSWYQSDLTAKASSKAYKIYPVDNQIHLTAGYWNTTQNQAVKAEEGSYTVTLRYYEIGENASSKLQSTQLIVIVK